ncbi:OmpP1/FadL family transporter [Dyella caseinilytica]|uniref:Outer membrane protein transport protein n=1 Tax=Dyella caseinilytica TaxID=1849581 RepID=A0ABX7GWD5_9GAMM|nr:outer membrane protein transport protein [Dyella caseinilytica]QRN54042.1 outer membrane protein transport protein [Dyella caseinilytica]GFZ91144.1 membrane protein [Dyella caseinilytica]
MHISFRNTVRGGHSLALAALGLAIAGALAAPQQAHASAFQLKEDSAQSMGMAYAGSLAADGDVSVVANGPASMTNLKGTYFEADITAINFGTTFTGSAHDAFGNPISGNNGGNAGTTLPVPAIFFETQVSDRWHVGMALSVPFGFKTDYNSDWVGRYNAIESKFESLDGTFSASYDVTDNFSIGASAIAQHTTATLSNAINFATIGQQLGGAAGIPPAEISALIPPGTDGYARVNGHSWDWGWQLGGYWKIDPKDRLGFNYRSKITHRLEGTADFTVPQTVSTLLGQLAQQSPALGAATQAFQNTQGTALFTTPAVATASYWHQEDKFGFGADVSWTEWDVFKNLTVNYANPYQPATTQVFNWHNSWYASLGGEYYLTDKFTVRAGLGFDTTPTAGDTRDVRVPDETRKLLSVGVGYKATEHFTINASYAHIFVNRAAINNDVSATEDAITGSSSDYGNLFALSGVYKF